LGQGLDKFGEEPHLRPEVQAIGKKFIQQVCCGGKGDEDYVKARI